MLNKKIEMAEAQEAKEKLREEQEALKQEAKRQKQSKTSSRRRSTAMNPIVKVLTSATFIRSVFGILNKALKK